MKEIKFRAWVKKDSYSGRNDGQTMFYGVENTYDNTIGQINGDSFGELINNDNVELMQFTGLKDKNGKEIYEGDILKVESYGGIETIQVKFNEKYAGWDFFKFDELCPLTGYMDIMGFKFISYYFCI